jgi:hypothetical protein
MIGKLIKHVVGLVAVSIDHAGFSIRWVMSVCTTNAKEL